MKLKYSIFINLPSLETVAEELAGEVGNPPFMPHVTLAGHLHAATRDATSLTKQVAGLAEPFDLDFVGFGTLNREFRFFCLLALPSPALASVYEAVHNIIPEVSGETFNAWPHASLLYGTPSAVKQYASIDPLINRFGQTLDGEYQVSDISLWETNGPIESWKEIESFRLGAQ
jgi:2'-5' RNA ligase